MALIVGFWQFGQPLSYGCDQRAGALDDLLVGDGDSGGGKEGNEVAHREGTFAWRARIDNRLPDVRGLEPEQKVDLLERCVVEIARSMFRQRDPTRQGDLDGLRKRRRVLLPQRSIRADTHRKPERELVNERLRQRASEAIARADERD